MRLIDAEKLITLFQDPIDYADVYVRRMIDVAHTIDAAPVVRGEWINTYADDEEIGDFVKHCSVCCNAIIKRLSASLNYCPNCGAKMESEGSNNG